MENTVLIVDDENQIRYLLRRVYDKEGFRVVQASSGRAALQIARKTLPSLIVLDLGLPDITGLDVCAAIKNDPKISSIPIIIITGKDQEGLNIVCLDQGADDYLTKPFDFKELVARTRAVLRRIHYAGGKQELLKKDGIVIDVGRRAIFVEDWVVENLTPKEFDLFYLLVQNSPNMLSRKYLATKIWQSDLQYLNSRTIDVHIRRIRLKLGDKITSRLKSVPGRGYKFV